MARPLLALLVAFAGVAGACGGGTEPRDASDRPAARADVQPTAAGCRAVARPRPRTPEPTRPARRLRGGRSWTVTLDTNCGEIAIRLATKRSPRTTASFASLVRRGFYDGLTFHRIAGDPATGPFVIQGGDPLGTGLGGPGYSVVEAPPAGQRYTRGTVAMAKTAAEPPGASGSQFFIVTAADAGLPAEYALVGRVVDGQETVARIASARTGPDERPAAPVVIERARLTRS